MHFNPGTIALIDVGANVTKLNTSMCKCIWWAFKPMIDRWQHAQPVISIDGSFLIGKYNGSYLLQQDLIQIINSILLHMA